MESGWGNGSSMMKMGIRKYIEFEWNAVEQYALMDPIALRQEGELAQGMVVQLNGYMKNEKCLYKELANSIQLKIEFGSFKIQP